MTDNQKLVEACYESIEMCLSSLSTLKKDLKGKDNKIISSIEEEWNELESYQKKLKKLIKKYKVEVEKIGLMPKMASKMGIHQNVAKDNSDSKISDILIKGYTMGSIEIHKKIDDFKEKDDDEILSFAKQLLGFYQDSIEYLQKYL